MLGYSFLTLDKEQKVARRQQLDRYATIAQWSALVVPILFQLSFLVRWAFRKSNTERPRSPHPTANPGQRAWILWVERKFNQLKWWADVPSREDYFTNGEVVLRFAWTGWILFLCFHQTGGDYLHLTKRFGIVGASQLPLQYLLAMRSAYSPIQVLTGLSYERVMMLHQTLGKIITLIFGLHAAFYLNFFIQSGVLQKRIREVDVITGLIGMAMFSLMSTTASDILRKWNYRVFYTTHVIVAITIIDVLIFHVTRLRTYVFEVLAVLILMAILKSRKLRDFSGTVVLIPGTDLVQITIPLPSDRDAKDFKPGQHVHLCRPSLSQSSSSSILSSYTRRYRTNPFTIASLPAKDRKLLLISRTLNGNTRHLAETAKALQRSPSTSSPSPLRSEAPSIPLTLEGPYGVSRLPTNLQNFDRVLLVAGGVGATFAVPVYRSLVEAPRGGERDPVVRARVQFVWAVRRLRETGWAFAGEDGAESQDESGRTQRAMEVFVTRGGSAARVVVAAAAAAAGGHGGAGDEEGADDIELAEGEALLHSHEEDAGKTTCGRIVSYGRPDLRAIVDETLTHSTGRVAVLVCGPKSMVEELRSHVGPWVYGGRDVFWHAESFAL